MSFILSDNSDADFIRRCYLYFLAREPDSEGMDYYLGRLSQGMSRKDLIQEISVSDELIDLVNVLS